MHTKVHTQVQRSMHTYAALQAGFPGSVPFQHPDVHAKNLGVAECMHSSEHAAGLPRLRSQNRWLLSMCAVWVLGDERYCNS